MKILFCDHCGELVQLENENVRLCRCGSIGGRYLHDKNSIGIYLREPTDLLRVRAIAIANEFVQGYSEDSRIWVMPWKHWALWYYINEGDIIIHCGKVLPMEEK